MGKKYKLPISVIIPCFNYAHYLDACITSIIEQVHSALEIIVIDDGSTDDTKHVVQSLIVSHENFNIQYIYQKNKGVSAARNYGYTIAKGEYLLFLDAFLTSYVQLHPIRLKKDRLDRRYSNLLLDIEQA